MIPFKKHKKGEAAEKSQMELVGLILSLIIIVVVIIIIFKFIRIFSPHEDPYAKAFYQRFVQSLKYLEPNSSTVVVLTGETDEYFKGKDGNWGVIVIPRNYDYNNPQPINCSYRKVLSGDLKLVSLDEGIQSIEGVTRSEKVSFSCDESKMCACLVFINKDKNIIYAKCDSIQTRLNAGDLACYILKFPQQTILDSSESLIGFRLGIYKNKEESPVPVFSYSGV
ncbi:MAG: hypothetical protein PWR32_478 [Candidatus Woesearchaeota archaeon]|nr:hypothetical protein [Candidatus Woesearchaeota archaeon]